MTTISIWMPRERMIWMEMARWRTRDCTVFVRNRVMEMCVVVLFVASSEK